MAVLVGTTTGTHADGFAAADMVVSQFTAVGTGTADQMSILLDAGSTFTSMVLVIYSESASNPAALLGQTVSITDTTAGVQSANLTVGVSIVTGTVYWIGALVLGGVMQTLDATVGQYQGRSGQATPPNPFGTSDFSFGGFSVPVTAQSTGGGGGSSSPSPVILIRSNIRLGP